MKAFALTHPDLDNPHPTPRLPEANTQSLYEKLNAGDTEGIRTALNNQDALDRQMAIQKAIAATSALGSGFGFVNAGVIPTLISNATGTAYAYGAGKVGEKLDERFDTH